MAAEFADPLLPFQIDRRVELHAIGWWTRGGVLEIRYQGKLAGSVELPPALWSVLASLVEASKLSLTTTWARAFVPAEKLAKEVERRAQLGSGDLRNLYHMVYKLKTRLNSHAAFKLQPSTKVVKKLGSLLVEQHPQFGYRLSIAPSQLQLTLLDDAAAAPP